MKYDFDAKYARAKATAYNDKLMEDNINYVYDCIKSAMDSGNFNVDVDISDINVNNLGYIEQFFGDRGFATSVFFDRKSSFMKINW